MFEVYYRIVAKRWKTQWRLIGKFASLVKAIQFISHKVSFYRKNMRVKHNFKVTEV